MRADLGKRGVRGRRGLAVAVFAPANDGAASLGSARVVIPRADLDKLDLWRSALAVGVGAPADDGAVRLHTACVRIPRAD